MKSEMTCMGQEVWVSDRAEMRWFTVEHWPFSAHADTFAGKCGWSIWWTGAPDRTLDSGKCTSLEECCAAIDAARVRLLRDLGEQIGEATR